MKRILLVEDNEINRKLCLNFLKKLGYTDVVTADNGQIAVDMLAADESIALVLMDCRMPVMDGYEATRVIRSSPVERISKIPIIAVTANSMVGDREKCLAAGMDDYYAKPISLDGLKEVIGRYV
ncbi:MAG: response regulator [Negativicutes bacterium]|nr:response regulator [Negativicutes bacterium]